MGFARTELPSCIFHSGLPSLASSAKKLPWLSAQNTSPPAVASVPVQNPYHLELPLYFSCRAFKRLNRAIRIVAVNHALPAASTSIQGVRWFHRRMALEVVCALLARVHVHEPGQRTVRWTGPVNRTSDAGIKEISLRGRVDIRHLDRPSFRVQSFRPRFLGITAPARNSPVSRSRT